ncbi:MAG: Hpt domain-containing protein [Burkholderiales bacterium]
MDKVDLLDLEQIEDLRRIDAGKGAVLARMVDKFAAVIAERVDLIHSHFASRNMTELAMAAHSLKGAAGNLGASRLAALCAQIERAGHDKAEQTAETLIEKLRAEGEVARVSLLRETGQEP